MDDWFHKLQKHPFFRKTAGQLSIPLAPELLRARVPETANSLKDSIITFGGNGYWQDAFAQLAASEDIAFAKDAEKHDALVFDATSLRHADEAEAMYQFFASRLRALRPNGRVVILALPSDLHKDASTAAYQSGLTGFTKSLAKELGRKGATCHLLLAGSEPMELLGGIGVLKFLLSRRSAFITGQVFAVQGADGPLSASLVGKTALVTGAAGGIGTATAKILHAYGAKLVVCDHPGREGALAQLAAAVNGVHVSCDLRQKNASGELASFVTREVKDIDILIHNAGITRDKTLAKMGLDQWQDVVQINLQSVIETTDSFLNRKLVRPGGAVICVSSISGLAGNFGQTAYALSKAGLVGYVKSLACRLAEQRIRCNAVAPGFIETEMTKDLPLMVKEFGRRLATLKQGGLPEDVGEALAFLASAQAGGLNGSVVRVCGGHLMGT